MWELGNWKGKHRSLAGGTGVCVGGLSGISSPWQGQARVPRLRDVRSLASPPDDNHTMLLVEVEARMRPARIRTPAKAFLAETSHTDDNDGNRNGLPEASTTRSSTHPPSNSRTEGDVESRRSEPVLRVTGVMPGAQHGTVGRWGGYAQFGHTVLARDSVLGPGEDTGPDPSTSWPAWHVPLWMLE